MPLLGLASIPWHVIGSAMRSFRCVGSVAAHQSKSGGQCSCGVHAGGLERRQRGACEMTKNQVMQIATLALLAAVLPGAARAAQRRPEGLPDSIRYYESVSMMSPAAAANQVAGAAGSPTMDLSFYTLGRQFDLKLEAHDPFAPGAAVHWVDDAGEVVERPEGGIYFRGHVEGDPKSWVRITLRGDALAGVIETDDELYFLEPAARFFGAQAASETLAYRLSDVATDDMAAGCATEHRAPRRYRTRADARAARQALHDLLHKSAIAAAGNTVQRAQI